MGDSARTILCYACEGSFALEAVGSEDLVCPSCGGEFVELVQEVQGGAAGVQTPLQVLRAASQHAVTPSGGLLDFSVATAVLPGSAYDALLLNLNAASDQPVPVLDPPGSTRGPTHEARDGQGGDTLVLALTGGTTGSGAIAMLGDTLTRVLGAALGTGPASTMAAAAANPSDALRHRGAGAAAASGAGATAWFGVGDVLGDAFLGEGAVEAITAQLMQMHAPPPATRASAAAIAALPRVTVPSTHEAAAAAAGPAAAPSASPPPTGGEAAAHAASTSRLLGQSCTVCHDEFAAGEQLLCLPCLHAFHEPCILPWLHSHNTCPVCRFTLEAELTSEAARTVSAPLPWQPPAPQQAQLVWQHEAGGWVLQPQPPQEPSAAQPRSQARPAQASQQPEAGAAADGAGAAVGSASAAVPPLRPGRQYGRLGDQGGVSASSSASSSRPPGPGGGGPRDLAARQRLADGAATLPGLDLPQQLPQQQQQQQPCPAAGPVPSDCPVAAAAGRLSALTFGGSPRRAPLEGGLPTLLRLPSGRPPTPDGRRLSSASGGSRSSSPGAAARPVTGGAGSSPLAPAANTAAAASARASSGPTPAVAAAAGRPTAQPDTGSCTGGSPTAAAAAAPRPGYSQAYYCSRRSLEDWRSRSPAAAAPAAAGATPSRRGPTQGAGGALTGTQPAAAALGLPPVLLPGSPQPPPPMLPGYMDVYPGRWPPSGVTPPDAGGGSRCHPQPRAQQGGGSGPSERGSSSSGGGGASNGGGNGSRSGNAGCTLVMSGELLGMSHQPPVAPGGADAAADQPCGRVASAQWQQAPPGSGAALQQTPAGAAAARGPAAASSGEGASLAGAAAGSAAVCPGRAGPGAVELPGSFHVGSRVMRSHPIDVFDVSPPCSPSSACSAGSSGLGAAAATTAPAPAPALPQQR